MRRSRLALVLLTGSACAAAANLVATAAELKGMEGYDKLFGEYAPGGDCKREPRIVVDATGIAVVIGGQSEKSTNPESALGFAGPDYAGISLWILPFRSATGYSLMMTFNDEEKPGRLTITGHDEGYQGGPKLSPRNQALLDGSPYQRCAASK